MKFIVTEVKDLGESINLDSLKDKFLSEGWSINEKEGSFEKDGKTIKVLDESFKKLTDKQIKDLRKNAIDYTNKRLKNWYVNAKTDYGVDGKGTAKIDIKNNLFIVDYVENGKKFQWEMAYYDEYAYDNKPEYFFNVWMEQAVSETLHESLDGKVYFSDIADGGELSKEAQKEADSIDKWIYSQSWSGENQEKLEKERVKRLKNFKKKYKLDFFINESKNFKKSELDSIVSNAVTDLFKGLNTLETAFNYLKSVGQGGAVGAFKKQYKYEDLKKIIDKLDDSISESVSESDSNGSIKVRFNGKVSVYFSDGVEVYTSPKDGSFEYNGVRFKTDFSLGEQGLYNTVQELNDSFEDRSFSLVKDLRATSIFESSGLNVESAILELDSKGSKKKYVETIITKGKSQWKILDFGGSYFDVYKYTSGKKVGLSPMGKTFHDWDTFADNYKSIKEFINTEVKELHLANRSFVGMTKGVIESVQKSDLGNISVGTKIESKDNIFVVTSIEDKVKNPHFKGELYDKKGKLRAKESMLFFSNFDNPHYKDNISIVESEYELNNNVSESRGDAFIEKYPNAANLVAKWVGLDKVSQLKGNEDALSILADVDDELFKIADGRSKDNTEVYKIIANKFLNGKIFDEDKSIFDKCIENMKKFGHILM